MNGEQTKIFQNFVQDALQQTLEDVSLTRVADPEHGDPIQWLDPIHVSIMRFHGDGMQGNCILGCDLSFLQRTCPHYDPNVPDHLRILQDWIGELSNLVMGRLKNKLLPFGTVIKLNPPSVTEATGKIFDLYATHSQTFKLWFTADKDYVCLAFSLDVSENIDLHVSSGNDEGQLQPGDAIYRLTDMPNANKNYDMVSKVRSGFGLEDEQGQIDTFDFVDDVVEPERFHSGRAEDKAPSWAQPSSAPIALEQIRAQNQSSGISSGWNTSGTKVQSQPKPALESRPQGKLQQSPEVNVRVMPGTDIKTDSTSDARRSTARRVLEAVECLPSGELHMRFQGRVTYTLTPQRLLQTGWSSITIEGYQLQISASEKGTKVSIPELHMTLEQGSVAA